MAESSSAPGSLTVLVVEDDPAAVRLIEEAFADVDCRVESVVATDGVEVFDVLHRRGTHAEAPRPDLIMLDLDLPRRSGREVLAELEDDDQFGAIPVLVLSQTDDPDVIDDCLRRGAEEYHVKPGDYEGMVDTVAGICDRWTTATS